MQNPGYKWDLRIYAVKFGAVLFVSSFPMPSHLAMHALVDIHNLGDA